MKKNLSLYLIAAILVLSVVAGVILTRPQPAAEAPGIPVTGFNRAEFLKPFSNPYAGANLDIAQADEIAKLSPYASIVLPPYTDQLDVAQQDEVAKLGPYAGIFVPPFTGELDVAQQDEVAKLDPYAGIVLPPFTGELDVAQQDEVNKLNP